MPSTSNINHASARNYETHVEVYIQEDLKHGALYGPFQDLDFTIHVSPLMDREKQNSTTHSRLMDLSWPKGFSVNDAIHKCKYLDSYFTLQYPSVDHIIEEGKKIGPGALLYKVDISRVFRHIHIDLGDIDLLGLHHRHTFLYGCHLDIVSDPELLALWRRRQICYDKHDHNSLLNYIDDLIHMGLPSKIYDSYQFLLSLLKDLGLLVWVY